MGEETSGFPKQYLYIGAPVALVALAGILYFGGLFRTSELQPVKGTVLYKGEPAKGATVTFVKKDGDPMRDPTPTGMTGADGSFTLTCPNKGEGAPVGEYKVLVIWRIEPTDAQGNRTRSEKREPAPPDKLNGRYTNAEKPLLNATVVSGRNTLPAFELTD